MSKSECKDGKMALYSPILKQQRETSQFIFKEHPFSLFVIKVNIQADKFTNNSCSKTGKCVKNKEL